MNRKEKITGFINDDIYTPMKAEEMATVLSVPKEDKQHFFAIIDELIAEGVAIKTKRGNVVSSEKMGYITGIYSSSAKGFGFVIRNDAEDIFITKEASWGAMHGDKVVARITTEAKEGRRCEGEVVRIAERNNKCIVGILRRRNKEFYLQADNDKIWQYIDINKQNLFGAQKGQKVYVEILKYPTDKERAKGKVIEVLGWPEDRDVQLKSVMYSYGLKNEFPESVLKEAAQIPLDIQINSGRRDLRNKTIITIDGEDAKDLDDAVCVEEKENGNYLLSVHIADVSEYVKEGSALDKEAFERGTSVYLPGSVIPMLPPKLSNGICSLNPAVPRLTLSVDMEFDPSGDLISHDIYSSVISTTERMTYTDVQKIIDGDKETSLKYSHITPLVLKMNELAKILRKKRMKNGFIDFDFPESQVVFDDDMNVIGVAVREITEANQLIEEFMLAANNCVAEHFFWLETPFVYRVHENPDIDKITELKKLLSMFEIKLKGKEDDIKPKELSKVLEQVKNEPYGLVVQESILRSMKKAVYSTDCLGHFGLSAKYYCHFTSPIRRYPDLIIHRIIKEYIANGGFNENREKFLRDYTEKASIKSSETEINAQEAERTATKIKVAEYMSVFVGRQFTGVVASVTNFGMFVRLPNLVEGLVRLADMQDDYYDLISHGLYLKGERTGKEYHIGQEVDVILASANELTGDIDFVLA